MRWFPFLTPSAKRLAVERPAAPAAKGWHPAMLATLISALLTTVYNLPFWRQFYALPELHGPRGLLMMVCTALLLAALTTLLLSALTWRWLVKPALILCVLSAAAGMHFMLAYGVLMDKSMLANMLQTNPREALDLVNPRLLLTLLVLGVVPAVWLARQPIRVLSWRRALLGNAALAAVSLGCAVGAALPMYKDFSSAMRTHDQIRYLINPWSAFVSLGRIAAQPFQIDPSRTLPIAEDAQWAPAQAAAATPPPLLVLVVGETARSANFSLNGYARPTNARLQQLPVVSQQTVWACGTSTAASLPCMFSHLGKSGFESRKNNYENLLDVLKRAGFDVLWMDNQSGCKGVCDRIPSYSTASLKNPLYCQGGECLDNVMLEELPAQLQRLQGKGTDRPTVVVLHQMGSHGPAYYRRSDAQTKPFADECASNAFDKCQTEQIVNAYDNSIAYTDQFLARTIQWLQGRAATGQPTAMMYISDHGESLGEDGLYLHGIPYAVAPAVQTQVPWITWLSPEFLQNRGIRMDCLQQQKDRAITHDYLFHSVLGMLGVKTAVYRSDQDLFAACRR